MPASIKDLNNVQIMALAIYVAGGRTQQAQLEDIAIEADKIVPGRYRWRKRDYISDRLIVSWLSDARKEDKGGLALGTPEKGYMLTEEGIKFVDENKHLLTAEGSKETRLSQKERAWINKEKKRILGEPAYQKFHSGNGDSITRKELENLFRINEYIQGKAREQKITQFQNLFDNSDDAHHALKELGKRVIKEEANGN